MAASWQLPASSLFCKPWWYPPKSARSWLSPSLCPVPSSPFLLSDRRCSRTMQSVWIHLVTSGIDRPTEAGHSGACFLEPSEVNQLTGHLFSSLVRLPAQNTLMNTCLCRRKPGHRGGGQGCEWLGSSHSPRSWHTPQAA